MRKKSRSRPIAMVELCKFHMQFPDTSGAVDAAHSLKFILIRFSLETTMDICTTPFWGAWDVEIARSTSPSLAMSPLASLTM
jgi:hypothetical protein